MPCRIDERACVVKGRLFYPAEPCLHSHQPCMNPAAPAAGFAATGHLRGSWYELPQQLVTDRAAGTGYAQLARMELAGPEFVQAEATEPRRTTFATQLQAPECFVQWQAGREQQRLFCYCRDSGRQCKQKPRCEWRCILLTPEHHCPLAACRCGGFCRDYPGTGKSTMCFALLAIQQHPDYPFILAANRDEFFARPSQPLHRWSEPAGVVGARSGGRWFLAGAQSAGPALALGPMRQGGQPQTGLRSRGQLVLDLVSGTGTVQEALQQLQAEQADYAGFNVLAGEIGGQFYYLSNRNGEAVRELGAGLYGLSNAALDTPWPKVVRGKQQLQALLQQPGQLAVESLFAVLADRFMPEAADLPDTGIDADKERYLAPLFINGECYDYGTRCSTVIMKNNEGAIECYERSFDKSGLINEVGLIL
ncbi:MAG: NRDE family protein [Thiolinea sp.]